MFNIEGNNIIINYNIIVTLFRFILTKFIQIAFSRIIKNLQYSILSNYINIYGPYYSSFLYYYNNLNFVMRVINNNNKAKREKSINIFWNNICRNFSKSSYFFPLTKNKNELKVFFLNDYLKELMIYDKINYKILYSFLINYFPKKNNYNSYLLVFLLKEKWNIDFKFNKDYSFSQDSPFFYGKYKKCLNHIKDGKTNIFISLVILRRTLPIILYLIKLYLENYDKDDKNFITDKYLKEKVEFQLFSYEKEIIWNNMRQIDILY